MKTMTLEQKFDKVLDAFLLHVISKADLQSLMRDLLEKGNRMTEKEINRRIVGDEADES